MSCMPGFARAVVVVVKFDGTKLVSGTPARARPRKRVGDEHARPRPGTAEQHEDLIRRVSVGRSVEQAAMLARARQVFEGEHPLQSAKMSRNKKAK